MADNIHIPDINNADKTIKAKDKSGVYVPAHITEPSDNLFPGVDPSITTSPSALPAQACTEILFYADPANTANILLGNSSSQTFPIAADRFWVFPVSDVSKVWRKAASGTQTLYWMARD